MIVLDANILLYAYGAPSSQHEKARACVEELFSGFQLVGLPWQTIAAFLRISTNPRLPNPCPVVEAVGEVSEWLKQPSVRLLVPGEDHWSVLQRMIVEGQAPGVLVSDALMAAITIEHGGILYTSDRHFSRFPGLRWKNPLS